MKDINTVSKWDKWNSELK